MSTSHCRWAPSFRGTYVSSPFLPTWWRSCPSIADIVSLSSATGPAPAPSSHKTTFSDKDREIIRKHARSSRVEQRTTGSSSTTTRLRVGERLPESVEIRSFPETVYRESPSLRDYRYIDRE